MPGSTKITHRFGHCFSHLPKQHLILAGASLALIALALIFTPSQNAQANRNSVTVNLQLNTEAEPGIATTVSTLTIPTPATSVSIPAKPAIEWKTLKIRNGDSLSTVFQRAGLGAKDVYELVNSSEKAKKLTNIFPGQKLAFQLDQGGKLKVLKHEKNRLSSTLYRRDKNGFNVTELEREPEVRQQYSNAHISSSLYMAAKNVGLNDNLIMEMANVFGGVIDFVYDVRAGDNFNILYEGKYLDGELIGYGNILATQYTNQGETHTAYRYEYENGDIGYYTPEGISMRKAFLRSPVDFTRISSSFNLKRLHPIFKTTRPHRGIDYAAATGTPVYAAGDGRVIKSGYTKANGNYVVIQHGQQYMTKYLHLHKRYVRSGQRVKQRKIIGTVGSTGYSTGPHLHYEFLVNGVHRNPRTIINKLPKAKSITDEAEKQRFLAQISGLQVQLAAYNSHHQLAQNDQLADKTSL